MGKFITSMSSMNMETFYRVHVNTPFSSVTVVCYGLWCIDNPEEGEYNRLQDLPDWVQGRIAVLMTINTGEQIPDIGWRITDNVFHIIKPIDGEADEDE